MSEFEGDLIVAEYANEEYKTNGTYYEVNDGQISFKGRE